MTTEFQDAWKEGVDVIGEKDLLQHLFAQSVYLPSSIQNGEIIYNIVHQFLSTIMMGKKIQIDDRFGKLFIDEQNEAIKWIIGQITTQITQIITENDSSSESSVGEFIE
jgi:hypothetical protein